MSSLGRSLSTRLPAKRDNGEPHSRPTSPQWSGPSHITIFLRALRLLNFEKLDDWPEISVSTFSGRVSSQNLQQRIKGTEWALYRLFEVWDPRVTQEKLKPFFPPLAPLQSKNLRAALFRALSDLKKDAVLGREITLRKTMLDECKGDKFEEVLSSFSMAVLRKALKEAGLKHDSMVEVAVASPDQVPQSEREMLLPKILAQRYALHRMIGEHAEIHDDYTRQQIKLRQAQESIASARRELRLMREEVEQISDIERKNATKAASTLESLWDGDPAWVEQILTFQDSRYTASDALHEESANDAALQPQSVLEDLEGRVALHRNRLQEWKAFRLSLERTVDTTKASPGKKNYRMQGSNASFTKHKTLNIASTSIAPDGVVNLASDADQYQELSDSLRESITAIKNGTRKKTKSHESPIAPYMNNDLASKEEKGRQENAVEASAEEQPVQETHVPAEVSVSVAPSTTASKRAANGKSQLPPLTNITLTPSRCPPEQISEAGISENNKAQQTRILSDESFPSGRSSGGVPIRATRALHLDTQQAEAPDEVKTSYDDDNILETSNFPDSHPSPAPSPLPETPSKTEDRQRKVNRLPIATLLERTRQSMSLLPNPPSADDTSTASKMRLKSQRTFHARPSMLTVHPVNPWETPQPKGRALTIAPIETNDSPQLPPYLTSEASSENNITSSINIESTSSTPRADLFSDDADYNSVFKSRPRIKMSPTPSPERSGLGKGLTWGVDPDGNTSD